jgi:hypothetical protein
MRQPKHAGRRDLRVLLEELARTPVEHWEQRIQGLHLFIEPNSSVISTYLL